MYQIKKVRINCTVDFAAEELKKYLRMMMPHCGEIDICLDPEGKDGFRLGLLEDFGLPNQAQDPALDDIVHIETDENGGILAGSNPRSVLFAVYRYLKENGCRFLFPGTDGEYIPCKPVAPVSYHHEASFRFRGHTTEGDPSFEEVLQYIDYHAKQELNVYSLFSIMPYHRRHYLHRHNEQNRLPEPISQEQVDQFKVLCEAELAKRGIQIHDGGHGWVERAAGFVFEERFLYKEGKKQCPEHIKPNLAMLNGVRDLNRKDPGFTNICMSRKDLRQRLTDLFVDHCRRNPQTTYVKLALADTSHNYCECPECKKLRPSDYYVILLNEIDEALTKENIPTRIIPVAYVDCMFAPIQERLQNPDRFLLQYTPISKKYNSSITADSVFPEPQEFVYNGWTRPNDSMEAYSYFRQWQEGYAGPCLGYEYHFWNHQYRDPGMMRISRRVYEDMLGLRVINMAGCTQDGSNKSFFPNGFADHIYGAVLLDEKLDYEKELEDYFFHCYGPDWKKVRDYLQKVSDAFDHDFMCGAKSTDMSKGEFYNPDHVKSLAEVKELAAGMREIIATHMAMPTRPQTVCWRLLLRHTQWCEQLAEVIAETCLGHKKYAMEKFRQFYTEFGRYDFELGRYFDFGLAVASLTYIVKNVPKAEF